MSFQCAYTNSEDFLFSTLKTKKSPILRALFCGSAHLAKNHYRAYSFRHLKSAKSSENSRLCRENFSYQKNGNSENGRVGRLTEKNAKRIRILKTVVLADFAGKNAIRIRIGC